MKDFFKKLAEKYLELLSIACIIFIVILYIAFVFSPFILSFVFWNFWWLLLYIIVGPILSVIDINEN